MKRRILLIFIVTLIFALTGCAYSEPNAKFTVTAIGFSAKGEEIAAYLQAIDFAASREGESEAFAIKGKGKDVYLALNDIKSKLSKEPSFEHCQIILLSNGIEGNIINQTFSLCEELEISGRTKVVYTNNIEKALKEDNFSSAADIVSLVKQNAEIRGYGNHGALFEIQTALLTNRGNFALVNIDVKNNELKFSGLLKYENRKIAELLSDTQSRRYAKEIN